MNSIHPLWWKLFVLNTNSQNKRFYGQPGICPCCNLLEESFSHMLSCSSDSSNTHREIELENLQNNLMKQGTPQNITATIIHGIANWILKKSAFNIKQTSPTFGSVLAVDAAITQAYYEQTMLLGWDNVL
jgi:hypothetical protein